MSTPERQAVSPATLRSPLSTAEDTGAARPSYSVVIPVFNSERIVGSTVERTISFFEGAGLDFEVILMLGMLGEYTVRTLNQVSDKETFHVVARLDRRE
jgi:hypothetical protein